MAQSTAIPRIIHQTWKSEIIPAQWAAFQRSWRAHHPAWTYRFFTDLELRELVREHDGWFLPIYDSYPQHIMRVDAARYLMMRRHGGLYADLDFESLRPIDGLLAGRELVLGCEPPEHVALAAPRARGLTRIVCNALIASIPGHPFWEHLLEHLVACHQLPDPLDATGPFLLTRAVDSYPDRDRVTIAPAELLYPISIPECRHEPAIGDEARDEAVAPFAVHHWAGSWWRTALTPATPKPRPRPRPQ